MKSKVIKAKDTSKADNTVVMREVVRPKIKPQTLADKIANDTYHQRNYHIQESQNKFPEARELWYVDRFYPYAEGGPLAVDEANDLDDVNTLMLKKPILAEKGIRYICIKNGMSENEVLEQLA